IGTQPSTNEGVRHKSDHSRVSFFCGMKPKRSDTLGLRGLYMPDPLLDLESRRGAVQSQIAQLGDMRSGSITGTGGRCGNPNCHCHRAGDPGHGPYYRLTRKVNGKTITETFSTPEALA